SSNKPRFAPEPSAPRQDAAVLAELDRILSSEFFRSSPRSREFLRHIVTYVDEPSELKERTIGIAVFGRAADYDTGADAIVRVKALDLRKRLAQYNMTPDPERSVRIELQAGSYLPKISYCDSPEAAMVIAPPVAVAQLIADTGATKIAAASIQKKARFRMQWMTWASVAIVLLLSLTAAIYGMARSPAKRFLQPFVASASQPIISLSHPNAYNLSLETVKKKGDAPMAFRLREMLLRKGRTPRLSVAADLTAEDLKDSPVILLGGPRHNRWTAALTQDLRFSFQIVDNKPRITDRQSPLRYWEDANQNDETSDDDYVIITRLLATQKTQPVLCIAGLRAQGTLAGAQIAFDETALRQILRYAPDNWDQKNLQLVLHVKFRGDAMPIFDLRAATYW
ncbi:MAG TPA: hypothetical protein VK638_16280, partial [Edaphobacter sp.]|nr:hypothetical protein [Edaphobacter sp.]